jgi:hypothetical protein
VRRKQLAIGRKQLAKVQAQPTAMLEAQSTLVATFVRINADFSSNFHNLKFYESAFFTAFLLYFGNRLHHFQSRGLWMVCKLLI